MSRGKRSGCERDALTRDCPTCWVTTGNWCYPMSRTEATDRAAWDDGDEEQDSTHLHLSRHTFLTPAEASRFLGVGYLSVTRAVKAGALDGSQDAGSGRWLVDARSVEAYLERMTDPRRTA